MGERACFTDLTLVCTATPCTPGWVATAVTPLAMTAMLTGEPLTAAVLDVGFDFVFDSLFFCTLAGAALVFLRRENR